MARDGETTVGEAQAQTKQIVIDGINMFKAVDAFKTNVMSKGINGENEYDLTNIYCVDELPECETSLPDSLELRNYPHLSEVDMYALDR